jgi:glutamine synthetase
MANEQIIELISKSQFNKVKFAVADIDGILRGKIIHRR